jgi:hypothetical protein
MRTCSTNRFDVIVSAARKREEPHSVFMADEIIVGVAHSLAAALKVCRPDAQLAQQRSSRPVICLSHVGEVHERGPTKVKPGEKIKISGLGNFEARKKCSIMGHCDP